MKRRILVQALVLGTMAVGLAACEARQEGAADPARAPDGWVAPPQIESAARTAAGLTVRGRAAPLGRVVLRGDGERAYATGADTKGQFELKVQTPLNDTLFVVETQNGQDAAPAPYRLFVTHEPNGPIALLTPGAPSRRLDRSAGSIPRLDVVDTDGRGLLLSDHAASGSQVSVGVAGGAPVPVRVDADGLWTAQPVGERAQAITVGTTTYDYPGGAVADGAGSLSVRASQDGWSVTWATPAGGRQRSWFPAR